jgi:hypothetical protein
LQTTSTIKDIPIKSNKTFLLEYFNLFFYVYSNKMIESFKNKNSQKYDKNILDSLSIDDLFVNKNNNINLNKFNFMNKNNSDYSLSEKIIEKKKIISDNKVFELCENNPNNDLNEKLIPPKLGIFSSSSLGGIEPYAPHILYDAFNRQQSNNLDSNLNLNRFQTLASSSFPNSLNRAPSLSNINKNILTPPRINRDFLNYYNNMKASNSNLINQNNNSMLPINPDICAKKTLLSPPPPINNYAFSTLTKLTTPQLLVNDKNINNFTFSSSINENNGITENEKNSTLNMFNKKRKRDIKNNKLVFILGDNKKEKKEVKKQKINNEENNQNKETNKKSEENSEKNRKPRGSKFRGVSRNGNQWQVLIMVNKKKRYVGSYSKEEDAARAYDKVALQNHGSKAKTNFDYTKKEVEEILASPQLLKLN